MTNARFLPFYFLMKMLAATAIGLLAFTVAAGQTPTPTSTPPEIREEVTVTATRTETRLGETPASIALISRREIETAAAPSIDDVLRQTVGFSIFRRSSSRNANPTTQGVSLRGVGSSGASRTIVLFDGVPLNDPFGGWVQWNRVPPIELQTVEVLRGGASSLYGDSGLSGAINLLPRRPTEKVSFSADIFGGSQRTASASGWLGFDSNDWLGSMTASSFQTRGYVPVDEAVRGPVDSFAGARSNAFSGRFERRLGSNSAVFLRPSYFGEVRTNGTGMQTNRTHIRHLVAGGHFPIETVRIDWLTFGGTQVYDQIFSAVNAARTSESLTRVQRVPAREAGLSVQPSGTSGDHTLVGGVDVRAVRGASDEIGFANTLPTSLSGSGGWQRTFGLFVHDLVKIGSNVVLAAGLRYDRWNNYAASSSTRTLATGIVTTTRFPDRDESALSPRFAMLVRLDDRFSFYANASRSFRSPTLNELYRAFRVGNVLTLANENLRAERANNFEGGISYGVRDTFLRAAAFWTSVDRTVSNVTLDTTPTLITRQRQNAGSTRSAGLEIEGETMLRQLTISAGYLFAHSTVTSFPSNPLLVGRRIPQVARHQVTFQASVPLGEWQIAAQLRSASSQFDDDLNAFRLEPYAHADLHLSRRIGENLTLYTAIENLFNSRYSIGRTPIRTVAAPVSVRLGLRWN